MFKNKWLTGCLLIGCILAVSVMSSIPMYSYAMFQRMLTKDLESIKTTESTYPGIFNLTISLGNSSNTADTNYKYYQNYNEEVLELLNEKIGLPVQELHRIFRQNNYAIKPEGEKATHEDIAKCAIISTEGIKDHIEIVAGKYPADDMVDGYYEVIATDAVLNNLDLAVGGKYHFYENTYKEPLPVHVVGMYKIADETDMYWLSTFSTFNSGVVISEDLYAKHFLTEDGGLLCGRVTWCTALDYTQLTVDNMTDVGNAIREFSESEVGTRMGIRQYIVDVLSSYLGRYDSLMTLLWILMIPLILMLVFYIYMVSQLSLNYEKNEIAVMKSRGSSNAQILSMYFYESVVLGVVSLAIGIPIGFVLCRAVGATSGFLEFVQRKAITPKINTEVIVYAVVAVALFVITMLIPVISAARTTIVKHKQKKAGKRKHALWEKLCLDLICIGVSIYGLYTYNQRQEVLFATAASGGDIPIDPLMFIMSTLFILGCGMFFLRIFPYIVKFIYWVGKRFWSPVMYYSLINVSRSGGQDKFVMLFLALTLSLGIFNSTAARTINQNELDKIHYATGADIVFKTDWEGTTTGAVVGSTTDVENKGTTTYSKEPLFDPYKKMEGVESATKVYTNNNCNARVTGGGTCAVRYMGIVTNEFATTSWFRNDLLPHNYYEYLNIIAGDARAVLVSSKLAATLNVKAGDYITVTMPDTSKEMMECIVYAVVDYWPTFNPEVQKKGVPQEFIIGNIDYMYKELSLDPYEVWLKVEDGYSSADIYAQLEEMGVKLLYLKDANQEVIGVRNDPMLQGLNGTLTMSFVITMAVTMIGFIIYWIFAMKERMLQFGILRSMGLSKGSLIMMIIWEQILISGSSIAVGTVIGTVTSKLFVPLFQVMSSSSEQCPPFRILALQSDYVRIFVIIGIMVFIGIVVISRLIANMKLVQTLKLGED